MNLTFNGTLIQVWKKDMGAYPGRTNSGMQYLYDPSEDDLPTELDAIPDGVLVSDLVIGTLFAKVLAKRGKPFKKNELVSRLGTAQFTKENFIRRNAARHGRPYTDANGLAMSLQGIALTGDPGLKVPTGGASCILPAVDHQSGQILRVDTTKSGAGETRATAQVGPVEKGKRIELVPVTEPPPPALDRRNGKRRAVEPVEIERQVKRTEHATSADLAIETLRVQNQELRQQVIDANRHALEMNITKPSSKATVTSLMAKELTFGPMKVLYSSTTLAIAHLKILRQGPTMFYDRFIQRIEIAMQENIGRFNDAIKEEEAPDSHPNTDVSSPE